MEEQAYKFKMIILNPQENKDKRNVISIPLQGTYFFFYKGNAEVIPDLEEKDLNSEEKSSLKKQGLKVISGVTKSYNKQMGSTRFLSEEELKKEKVIKTEKEKKEEPEEKPKEKKPEEKPKAKKLTRTEAIDLDKPEQIDLLLKLGVEKKDIPKREKDRVNKILELQ